MKNALRLGGALLLLAAPAALAEEHEDHRTRSTTGELEDHDSLYRSHEISLDVFGSASLGSYSLNNLSGDRVRHDTRLGVGLGLNYFLTRNLGLSADAYSEDTTEAFVDSISASLTLRLPLGRSGFAPYVFGGGGRQFDLAEAWFVQLGTGMEYRFTRNIGAFLDARWVLPDETKYYGVARLGLRVAF